MSCRGICDKFLQVNTRNYTKLEILKGQCFASQSVSWQQHDRTCSEIFPIHVKMYSLAEILPFSPEALWKPAVLDLLITAGPKNCGQSGSTFWRSTEIISSEHCLQRQSPNPSNEVASRGRKVVRRYGKSWMGLEKRLLQKRNIQYNILKYSRHGLPKAIV